MKYRLNQSYYVLYPLSANIANVTEFACYYTIDYTFSGRNYLTVDVLEDWALAIKPIAVSAAMKLPYDTNKTEEQNAKPDDRWQLVFQNQNAITIGDWKALTPKDRAEYLGLEYKEPEPEKDPDTDNGPQQGDEEGDKEGVNGATPGAVLTSLFSSTNPKAKTNWLWLILAGILTLTVGVSVWAYRRYRRARKKAEMAAFKYGKYSRDIVDAVT